MKLSHASMHEGSRAVGPELAPSPSTSKPPHSRLVRPPAFSGYVSSTTQYAQDTWSTAGALRAVVCRNTVYLLSELTGGSAGCLPRAPESPLNLRSPGPGSFAPLPFHALETEFVSRPAAGRSMPRFAPTFSPECAGRMQCAAQALRSTTCRGCPRPDVFGGSLPPETHRACDIELCPALGTFPPRRCGIPSMGNLRARNGPLPEGDDDGPAASRHPRNTTR